MLRPQHAGYLCLRIRPLPAISDGAAAIAQLVEHVIRNDGVGGSNPSCGTRSSDMNECVHLAVGTRRRFAAWTPVPSPSILLASVQSLGGGSVQQDSPVRRVQKFHAPGYSGPWLVTAQK